MCPSASCTCSRADGRADAWSTPRHRVYSNCSKVGRHALRSRHARSSVVLRLYWFFLCQRQVIPHQGWKWIDADPLEHSSERDRGGDQGRRITQSVLAVSSGRCFAKSPALDPAEDGDDGEGDHSDATDMTLKDVDLDQDPLGLPWPTQQSTFDTIYAVEGSDSLDRICVLGQVTRTTFVVDGEYVRMNRRLSHHGKPVWYVEHVRVN